MSSLHDELSVGPACKVCAYLSTLTPEKAHEWSAELALPVSEVGNAAVVAALTRRGVIVTETSVRRHRTRHG